MSRLLTTVLLVGLLIGCSGSDSGSPSEHPAADARAWRAGDHHIHSMYSVDFDKSVDPPEPIPGSEGIYSQEKLARMGQSFGLSWMVVTDHGGPNHSRFNRDSAYPQLFYARKLVPDVIQFYGMEFDTPGAKHSTVIMPRTDDEAERLFELESAFGRKDAFPDDPARDTEERMLAALAAMQVMSAPPLLIVNHPAREATDLGIYGLVEPREIRAWHDAAPTVVIGMEGAPGHQASAIKSDGSANADGLRGGYDDYPTMGGFDQMTARVGGFWDSMLGEGRRWWITANSDSHIHYTEGDEDFWPGEYSKTYVYAEKTYADILQGLRSGNVFVTTGDLVDELYVTAELAGHSSGASVGETLPATAGQDILITVRFRDPEARNPNGDQPVVSRVDVITGLISSADVEVNADTNSTTVVSHRATADDWSSDGDHSVFTYVVPDVSQSFYIRVRGTNGSELEPQPDEQGENPWQDLWFYSNPVFIEVN